MHTPVPFLSTLHRSEMKKFRERTMGEEKKGPRELQTKQEKKSTKNKEQVLCITESNRTNINRNPPERKV
jgi:hypothetical protein